MLQNHGQSNDLLHCTPTFSPEIVSQSQKLKHRVDWKKDNLSQQFVKNAHKRASYLMIVNRD